MSFPRKPDGSLNLAAFQALPPDAKKAAILTIKDNPAEVQAVREYLVDSNKRLDAEIAEGHDVITRADAVISASQTQNQTLIFTRQQLVADFVVTTSSALNSSPARSSKKGCTIM